MDSAKQSRAALVQRIAKLAENAGSSAADINVGKTYAKGEAAKTAGLSAKAQKYLADFQAALENDLSTPVAMSQLQSAVKDSSLEPKEALELVRRMDSVTGLKLMESAAKLLEAGATTANVNTHAGDPEAAAIDALVAERISAKKAKNFARCDEIRKQLADKGIVITDTPTGPVWERK